MICSISAFRLAKLPICILSVFANVVSAATVDATLSLDSNRSSKQLSGEQRSEANARVQLANSIVNRLDSEAAAKHLEPSWRVELLVRLFRLTSEQLRTIEPRATTLEQAHALAIEISHAAKSSGGIAKSLGSTTVDLVFTPITPCRFIDTRNQGGPITSTRDFDTYNTGGSYGGGFSCDVPGNGEFAIAANVTVVVGAGAAGYIGIRPYGNNNTTSFLNWPSGGTTGLANAGIITTAQDSSGHYEFEVFNGGTTAPQVIMDYFGYFAPPAASSLTCQYAGGTYPTVKAGASNLFYTPACPTGFTAVSSICSYSSINAQTTLVEVSINACDWINNGTTDSTLYVDTWCCQVP